jgi:hypothetical protein
VRSHHHEAVIAGVERLLAEARLPEAGPDRGSQVGRAYLLLRPGSTDGVQLPRGHFDQFTQAAASGGSYPPWLAVLARQTWNLNLPDSTPMEGHVLVREESPLGYGRTRSGCCA